MEWRVCVAMAFDYSNSKNSHTELCSWEERFVCVWMAWAFAIGVLLCVNECDLFVVCLFNIVCLLCVSDKLCASFFALILRLSFLCLFIVWYESWLCVCAWFGRIILSLTTMNIPWSMLRQFVRFIGHLLHRSLSRLLARSLARYRANRWK